MITGQQVVDEARKYLGVPYAHVGRTTRALDCIGLLQMVANGLYLSNGYDLKSYSRMPRNKTIIRELQKAGLILDPAPVFKTGRVAVFYVVIPREGKEPEPTHAAILNYDGSRFTMIHTYMDVNAVTENGLGEYWSDRLYCTMSFPGVE